MGLVLVTVKYGKEDAAGIEILDCLLPFDLKAKMLPSGFGGLLLLESTLEPDKAAGIIMESPTSLVRAIVPVDLMVRADLQELKGGAAMLMGSNPKKFAVKCYNRGTALASGREVERSIGSSLRELGHIVDLESPELIVRIDIIGELATISVKPAGMAFKKV